MFANRSFSIRHHSLGTISTLAFAIAVGSALAMASPSYAEVIKWTGLGGDEKWSDKRNWDPKTVPGVADDVVIPANKGFIRIEIGLGNAAIEVNSLKVEPSNANPRTLITSLEKGRPVYLHATKSITIGSGSTVTAQGGKAGVVSDTWSVVSLESKDEFIVIDGKVLGANGPDNGKKYVTAGGSVYLTAKKGKVTVNDRVSGGKGGNDPGTWFNDAPFTLPGDGGSVKITAERIESSNGSLIGGDTGKFTIPALQGMLPDPKGGSVKLITKGFGNPTADNPQSGSIKLGESKGGKGKGSDPLDGDVIVDAPKKAELKLPAGKNLKGQKLVFNAPEGTIDLRGIGAEALESKTIICLNAGGIGEVLLSGSASNAMIAAESISIFGELDIDWDEAATMSAPDAEPAAAPCDACAADLDLDGDVDLDDVAALIAAMGECTGCAADLNGDAMVDGADLAILMAMFGGC